MKIGYTLSGLLLALLLSASSSSAYAGDVVVCESFSEQRRFCRVPGIKHKKVRLLRTLSKASCDRGYTWGRNDRGIWVRRGCRGTFRIGSRHARFNDDRYRGDDRYRDYERGSFARTYRYSTQRVKCESRNDRPQFCRVRGLRHKSVDLVRKLSEASCRRGSTWGVSPRGIWVRDGCRAILEVRENSRSHRDRDRYGYDDDGYWYERFRDDYYNRNPYWY